MDKFNKLKNHLSLEYSILKNKIKDKVDRKYYEIVLRNKEIAVDDEKEKDREEMYREKLNKVKSEVIYLNDRLQMLNPNRKIKEVEENKPNIKTKELEKSKSNEKDKFISGLCLKIIFFFIKWIVKILIIPFIILDIPYRVNNLSAIGVNPLLALMLVVTFYMFIGMILLVI